MIAPETIRTSVKVDASISAYWSAARHSNEFPANAIIASDAYAMVVVRRIFLEFDPHEVPADQDVAQIRVSSLFQNFRLVGTRQ